MSDLTRRDLLSRPVEHVDIRAFDARPVIDQYRRTAIQTRNLARAADICSEMLADRDCTVILTLAGSLVSAGLKKALVTLIDSGMVDVVVSTGANMVDQDFFEALGFRHYMAPGSPSIPWFRTSVCASWPSTASTTRTSTRTNCASATGR